MPADQGTFADPDIVSDVGRDINYDKPFQCRVHTHYSLRRHHTPFPGFSTDPDHSRWVYQREEPGAPRSQPLTDAHPNLRYSQTAQKYLVIARRPGIRISENRIREIFPVQCARVGIEQTSHSPFGLLQVKSPAHYLSAKPARPHHQTPLHKRAVSHAACSQLSTIFLASSIHPPTNHLGRLPEVNPSPSPRRVPVLRAIPLFGMHLLSVTASSRWLCGRVSRHKKRNYETNRTQNRKITGKSRRGID